MTKHGQSIHTGFIKEFVIHVLIRLIHRKTVVLLNELIRPGLRTVHSLKSTKIKLTNSSDTTIFQIFTVH